MYSTFSLWASVAKFQCLLKVVCRIVKLFQFHLYPFKDRQYKFMRLMHLCSWRNLVMRKSSFASTKEGVRTARVAPPISKNFKVFSDPTLNRGLLWLSKQTNPLINQFLHICDFLHHHDLLLQGAYSIVHQVIYIKYPKHWTYLLASTMDCGCRKIFNHGFFSFTFQVFWGVRIHSQLNLEYRFL